MYEVRITKAAKKEYLKLPPGIRQRVRPAIDALAEDPRPPGCHKLSGTECTYRIRVGDYRVIYDVYDGRLLVLIIRVRHRSEAYR
ncbi:MAG: type II toxin-antitoxin system RelE/ParE family toxin [Bacteroidetes bacterium]|jgi:mRNA interferase RelE/StbE|nr:type II toxin-antitoxin system RelE/ParE family toxin [Bacteroidota bacterium]